MSFRFRKTRVAGSVVAVRYLLAAVLGAVLLMGLAPGARADFVLNFETNPALPTQPNNFAAAGPMQTYSQAGVYSISGGVVLGNPTFLASFAAQGSPPNAYGTADFADPSLLSTISLAFPSAETVINVSGVLFNGQPIPETYTLLAFSGMAQVASQTFTNVPADNSASGFASFSLSSTAALPITSVTITTPDADINGWDFFVDTIQVRVGAVAAVPEPSALVLASIGAASLLGCRRRRRCEPV